MPISIESLAQFTMAYCQEIETQLDQLGRHNLLTNQKRCFFVTAYKASDGFAVFYMPGKPNSRNPGLFLFDYSKYTLNEILQSLHLHRLQLRVPELGVPFDFNQGPIEETALIPELNTYYFSDPVREAMRNGERYAPGLTITPIMNLEAGIVKEVRPCRIKLWTPFLEYPNIGRIQYFFWNHADIWWHPSDLSIPEVREAAFADINAIRILEQIRGATSPTNFGQDTNSSAAGALDKEIQDFVNLLDTVPSEATIHDWLLERRHFLDATARRVISKVPFGDRISDFVVERADGTYELIEIENTDRIFNQSSAEPSAKFNHACNQVKDWIRYINDNVNTVQNEQNLGGIYQPNGRVIMGRDRDIDSVSAKNRWKHLKSEKMAVETYDDLIARVSNLARILRSVQGRTS